MSAIESARSRARPLSTILASALAMATLGACSSGDSDPRPATADADRSAGTITPVTSANGAASSPAHEASQDGVIMLDGDGLKIGDIVAIADGRAGVKISEDGMARIRAARGVVDHYIEAKLPAYGITTMYGADFKTTLPPSEIKRFGRINIVQEATRVGDGSLPIVDRGTMRAAWALLVNSYARGFSGASPALARVLADRVNSGRVPGDVEYGNSMGDADLTSNAQAAMSLLADPEVELKAGEATNLLTHNFIGVALAAQIVRRAEGILAGEESALALSMEGFRANPAPLTNLDSREDVAGSRKAVRDHVRALLDGSRLWKPKGPRQLQDFLSLRDGAENLAALRLALDQYTPTLEAFANSNQGSPVVDVPKRRLVSVPDFDTTQVTVGLDGLRQALGQVVVASNSRGLKLLSRPFTDLPSGLVEGDPNSFNGIYTRNITYIMASLERSARLNTAPVGDLTESFVAEGDEDYSPAFPNSVLMAETLVKRAEQVMTLEALIGSSAIQRRIHSGELTKGDVPAGLRDLQAGIVKRSPLAIPIDRQYNLAGLLRFYVGRFPDG